MDNVLQAHLDLARENSKTLVAYESRIKKLEGELRQKADAETSWMAQLGSANTQIAALQTEVATWREVKERVEGWYLELKTREDNLKQGRRDLEDRTTALKVEVEEQRQRTQILEEQQGELRKEKLVMKESRQEAEQQKEQLGQRAKTLENLQVELQTKESDVKDEMERLRQKIQERQAEFERRESSLVAGRQYIEQRMATFTQFTEELVLQNKAKAESLRTCLREMMTEKDELQQDFKRILSVERGAYTALFEAKRLLEEEVRSMQTRAADAESAFVVELEQRYQAEKKLADAQARMATLEAERKSLQSEMETSRARYPAFGEFVRAQGTELGTTNAQESSERQWIQANLNDANRRVATYEGEKKAEGALAAKDSELQSQREKSDARIAGLKEKLTCVKEELAELDIENRNLRETHKQHLVEISELKTRIGRVKETFNKSKAEQDRQYDDLQSDYSELLNQYTEQTKVLAERDSALAQRDTTLAREIHKLQALTTENGKLQQTLAKLQATNKNLQSSVLRAGAEAKQELQKEANTERQNFEANIQALEKQNAELQKELNSVRIRSQELQMATDTERQSHETTMKIFQRAYETKLEAYDKLRAKLREEIRSLRTSLADAVRERDDPIESLNTVQPTWNYHHQAHSLDERAEQSDRSTRYSTRDDDDQSAEPTPEPHNLSERALYTRYMKSEFPVPANQPTLKDLEPIHRASGAQALDIFLVNNIHRQRRTLYCPKRSLWCGAPGAHVLVFAATCEYSKSGPTRMALNCGQQFDLFMNKGEMVYYVGIYEVLSLREVHPPGARIPTDVSRVAIVRGMGIHPGPEGKVNEKIRECYPDGDIRTECFGLRVIGFDHKLYENLREDLMSGDGDKKRKAGSEDLRNDGKKGKCKMQKV